MNPHCLGRGCTEGPWARIVSHLKNGLNWSKMLKFPAGSTRVLCSNLGGFSLRESVTLLRFS